MLGERIYLDHNDQVVVGADYQITDDLEHLKKFWGTMNDALGELPEHILRKYLGKLVFATEKRRPGVVKCLDRRGTTYLLPVRAIARIDIERGSYLAPERLHTNSVTKPSTIRPKHFTNLDDFDTGDIVKVTSDLTFLKAKWREADLPTIGEGMIRKLLRSRVKVENKETGSHTVVVRGTFGYGKEITLPWRSLMRVDDSSTFTSLSKPSQSKENEVKEMVCFDDFRIDRKYRVTTTAEELEEIWLSCDLDPMVDVSYFLQKEGWCTGTDAQDQLIKIEWSGEYEWFPWNVLSELPNAKKERKPRSSVWESTSTRSSAEWERFQTYGGVSWRSTGFGNDECNDREFFAYEGHSSAGKHTTYVEDASKVLLGSAYSVTNSLRLLKQSFKKSDIVDLGDEFYEKLLGRDCRALQVDLSDDTVQIRFVDTMGDRWLPASCLKKKVSFGNRTEMKDLPSSREFQFGDMVRLHGVANIEYENIRGRLVEYIRPTQLHPNGGKWRVKLLKLDRIVRVMAKNLTLDNTLPDSVKALTDVVVGKSYRITDDCSKLLQAMPKIVSKKAMELVTSTITVKTVNPELGTVTCVLERGKIEVIPFHCLERIAGP